MDITHESENVLNVHCQNGKVLVHAGDGSVEDVKAVIAEIKNEAAALPLTVLQLSKALENRGFSEFEYGSHRAYRLEGEGAEAQHLIRGDSQIADVAPDAPPSSEAETTTEPPSDEAGGAIEVKEEGGDADPDAKPAPDPDKPEEPDDSLYTEAQLEEMSEEDLKTVASFYADSVDGLTRAEMVAVVLANQVVAPSVGGEVV